MNVTTNVPFTTAWSYFVPLIITLIALIVFALLQHQTIRQLKK